MTDANARPLLTEARKAADAYLLRKVADGSVRPDVTGSLSSIGFTATTTVLSALLRDGLGDDQITDAYRRQLAAARVDNDVRGIVAAEYSLAIWGGMLADLAAYGRTFGTEEQQ